MTAVTVAGPSRSAKASLAWTVGGVGCVSCIAPALTPALAAVGLTGAAPVLLHHAGLAVAPLMVWLLWRDARRHGQRLPLRLGAAGGALLAVHAVFHVVPGPWLLFGLTNALGVALLLAGLVANVVVIHRLRRQPLACAVAG